MGKITGGRTLELVKRNLMKYRHVLWDWNGTLLDDVDLCSQVVAAIMSERGLHPISTQGYREVFGFPVARYYEAIGLGSGPDNFQKVTHAFMARYNQGVEACEIFQGVPELLADLRREGIQSSILTAAHESDVLRLLDHFGIHDFFTHVYGLQDHHAVSKVERGKQLIQRLACPPREVIMVGDTDHDWEVAQAMGIDVLLIADGHQTYDRLKDVTPYVLESRYRDTK